MLKNKQLQQLFNFLALTYNYIDQYERKILTLYLCLCLCAGNGGQDGANLTQIQVSPFHLVSYKMLNCIPGFKSDFFGSTIYVVVLVL